MTYRDEWIAGMRQVLDTLEKNPDLPLPLSSGTSKSGCLSFPIVGDGDQVREALAAARRAFGAGSWTKRVSSDDRWLNVAGQVGGAYIELYAARDAVCTRRVTGTQVVEEDEVITPAVTRKVKKTVDKVTWDCGSLLSASPGSEEKAAR